MFEWFGIIIGGFAFLGVLLAFWMQEFIVKATRKDLDLVDDRQDAIEEQFKVLVNSVKMVPGRIEEIKTYLRDLDDYTASLTGKLRERIKAMEERMDMVDMVDSVLRELGDPTSPIHTVGTPVGWSADDADDKAAEDAARKQAAGVDSEDEGQGLA